MFGREYSTTSSAAACAADAGVRTMYGAKPVVVVACRVASAGQHEQVLELDVGEHVVGRRAARRVEDQEF